MSKLNNTFYSTVDAIQPEVFEQINSDDNSYFSASFLKAFEVANPQTEFQYVVVKNHQNQAHALAVVQIISLSVEGILKNIKVSTFFRRTLGVFFCNNHIKIMFCGNVFLSGEHAISFSTKANKKAVTTSVGQALDIIARKTTPLHAIFIKDFRSSSLEWSNNVTNFGFTPIIVEPNMIIKLKPEWTTFEDYKKALKSKYRVKSNKADSTSTMLESRLLSENDFETYKDQLQSLYQNTIDNANFNAQVLNLNTYIQLKAAYNEKFIVKAYFYNNQIVGFLSALLNHSSLDAHFIGLNYDLNKAHAIYPRILNDYIRLGIENGVKSINLGRTASEIKTTVGATPVELRCYIKHKNPLINRLIKPLFKQVQVKSFKQHFPFKAPN